MDLEFISYRDTPPAEKGLYAWRLNHSILKDIKVIFLADYRLRGAGFQHVLSPSFDHWDGYSVILPRGEIEWASWQTAKGDRDGTVLDVVGAKNGLCPFCDQTPNWKHSPSFITGSPIHRGHFYLECCNWYDGFRNRNENPLTLSASRNSALKNIYRLSPHTPEVA